jgi:sialic acid synthase SpsE
MEPSLTLIAEPGGLAGGDLNLMLDEVTAASTAGFTHYKSQWLSNVDRMTARRRAGEYRQWYESLAWPVEHHAVLRAKCHEMGLKYVTSVYLPEDAETVAPFVDAIKVASFETQNIPLQEAVAATGKPRIVSLGMTSDTERATALNLLLGLSRSPLTVLHCVSAYPTPLVALDLQRISYLRVMLDEDEAQVGFSDHSANLYTAGFAVAAGADTVEVHVKLPWASPKHPDFPVALWLQSDGLLCTVLARQAFVSRGNPDTSMATDLVETPMRDYRVSSERT